MTSERANVRQLAQDWLEQDPVAEISVELSNLIAGPEAGDQHSQTLLERRFSARLAFGIVGIRGALSAGPAAMNRVVVAQTAAGLTAFLLGRHHNPTQSLRVTVEYDRRKNSAVFALDTARNRATLTS